MLYLSQQIRRAGRFECSPRDIRNFPAYVLQKIMLSLLEQRLQRANSISGGVGGTTASRAAGSGGLPLGAAAVMEPLGCAGAAFRDRPSTREHRRLEQQGSGNGGQWTDNKGKGLSGDGRAAPLELLNGVRAAAAALGGTLQGCGRW